MAAQLARGLVTWLNVRLRDRRGVAAVEFAFIVPLLITLYFGVIEVTYAIMADGKVTNVTSTVADLVAQTKTVNQAELDDIFKAAAAIMVPFNSTEATIVVSSVVIDADGNSTVGWSAASLGATTPYVDGAPYTLPTGLVVPNTSLIVAEVQYQYNSFLNYIVTSGISMSDIFYLRPRASAEVQKL